jgi:outer membrane cobalamin receptor
MFLPCRGWPALSALWLGVACLHPHGMSRPAGNDGDRILITEETIARSGGQTAWEVLKKEAPQLTYGERRDGRPSKLERRGTASFVLNDSPLLFVDGVQVIDIQRLQTIPASTLHSIEVLNGLDGTTYYGSNAVSGVILIISKNGTSSETPP